MGADAPKVLLPILGRPLIEYVLDAVAGAGIDRTIIVVSERGGPVERALAGRGLEFAVQSRQLGTADAVLACRQLMTDEEQCVVLCGDAPLVSGASVRRLMDAYRDGGVFLALLTARLDDPSGYGRVVRRDDGSVEAIVEERDASDEIRSIDEVNAGAYSFRWGRVLPVLERIEPSPVTGEYYVTDAVKLAAGNKVVPVVVEDAGEILGANTPGQLERVSRELAARFRSE